jgi:hypothetical protein
MDWLNPLEMLLVINLTVMTTAVAFGFLMMIREVRKLHTPANGMLKALIETRELIAHAAERGRQSGDVRRE